MAVPVAGGARQRVGPRALASGAVLLPNLVLGVPAYFVAFLFAYGFQDSIALAHHATFLMLVAMFAVVAATIGMALLTSLQPRPSTARSALFCLPMSLAINLAAIGSGSIVSATHKNEGSVSANLSATTDVLVAGGLFGLALVFAGIALRVDLKSGN